MAQYSPYSEVFSYLAPSVRLGRAEGGTTIVTLNYDLSIEGQAAAIGIPCDTGIRSWSVDGKLSWRIGSVNLLKLHGSIGWSFSPQYSHDGQLEEELVVSGQTGQSPAVIFGQREKLRATGPFLQLFDEFRKRLDTANQLVVIGYSFQDDHVNEIIRRWINRDKLRHIIVIDPFFPTHQMGAAEDSDFRPRTSRGACRPRNPRRTSEAARPDVGDMQEQRVTDSLTLVCDAALARIGRWPVIGSPFAVLFSEGM